MKTTENNDAGRAFRNRGMPANWNPPEYIVTYDAPGASFVPEPSRHTYKKAALDDARAFCEGAASVTLGSHVRGIDSGFSVVKGKPFVTLVTAKVTRTKKAMP